MTTSTFGHVMVDLETLGVTPGSVILSAAMVEFNPLTGATGQQHYMNIDVHDSIKKGFRIDARTLKWWTQQDPLALKKAFGDNGVSAGEFLQTVKSFVDACVSSTGVPPCLWSNSVSFDLTLIRSYYSKTDVQPPWRYTMEMCVRTLVNMVPEVRNLPFEGLKHDPLSDCFHQIKQVNAAYRKLGLIPNAA